MAAINMNINKTCGRSHCTGPPVNPVWAANEEPLFLGRNIFSLGQIVPESRENLAHGNPEEERFIWFYCEVHNVCKQAVLAACVGRSHMAVRIIINKLRNRRTLLSAQGVPPQDPAWDFTKPARSATGSPTLPAVNPPPGPPVVTSAPLAPTTAQATLAGPTIAPPTTTVGASTSNFDALQALLANYARLAGSNTTPPAVNTAPSAPATTTFLPALANVALPATFPGGAYPRVNPVSGWTAINAAPPAVNTTPYAPAATAFLPAGPNSGFPALANVALPATFSGAGYPRVNPVSGWTAINAAPAAANTTPSAPAATTLPASSAAAHTSPTLTITSSPISGGSWGSLTHRRPTASSSSSPTPEYHLGPSQETSLDRLPATSKTHIAPATMGDPDHEMADEERQIISLSHISAEEFRKRPLEEIFKQYAADTTMEDVSNMREEMDMRDALLAAVEGD